MFDVSQIANMGGDVEIQRRIYFMHRKMPMRTYLPTKSGADFLRAMGTGVPDKRVFLMTSGNGAGKTTLSVNILANLVWPGINIYDWARDRETGEEYPGFFNYPIFRDYPARWPKRIWYVSNQDSLKSIWEEFQVWIPKELYKESAQGKSYVSYVDFLNSPGGWRLWFKTIDQDPKTYESANIGVIIFDEPPPYGIFKAAVSRLRSGGIIIIPATPLFGSAWFVDEIVLPSGEAASDKYHQTVSVWSNCLERAGLWDMGMFGVHPKGNLSERDIEFTLRNYDPDEREARENGTFQHLVGVVYKTYGSEHFQNIPEPHNPEDYTYKFVLDPHDRKPPAALWMRVDKWDWHAVFREWPSPVKDNLFGGLPYHQIKSADPYRVADFVKMFIEVFKFYRIRPDQVQAIIDPNFGNKPNRQTGKTLAQEYQDEFRSNGYPIIFIRDVNDALPDGHKKVKDYLAAGTSGESRLSISRECVNTDWSMRNYSFDDWEGKQVDKKGIRESVKDKGKDFADLIRYGLMVPAMKLRRPEQKHSIYSDYGRTSDSRTRPPGSRFL